MMFNKISIILFALILIGYVTSGDAFFSLRDYEVEESIGCKEIETKSAVLQLRRHLFCEYVEDIRPVSDHRTKTSVYFGLLPKFIINNELADSMELHCWAILMWHDDHLTWEPSQFNDVKFLHVISRELWTPDIMVHNSEEHEIPFDNCWLSNTGRVKCVLTTKFSVKCLKDYTWWPYDVQNCTIQIGSWSHSSEEIDFLETGNIMYEFQKNMEWNVVQTNVTTHTEPFKFGMNMTSQIISFNFILRRHYNDIRVIHLLLIIILIIMTLTTLWLDPKSIERMILANLNFICHLLYLQIFRWDMPGIAIESAMLLQLFEKSFALACFTLIVTSILRRLLELTTETPTWIAMRISAIVKSKIGRILLISILDPKASAELEIKAEDNTNLVNFKKNEASWKHVVMLISWINFFCIFLAYIILISIYFPTESSGNNI
ncbi:PREDICTED: neuronal acetylcholine receptor subunit alpha-3-like [Polistes canadensis]|uniref:neuronal acetylcholine receptor subunit alpha-3-like n=1 Tax=Polistes canadensis TaxID=91411 RepID=UPI000718E972|nr:PREDICTED: neuronal acetylcholine receptor subunit alpha-3-like [Polistes canadensis]